MLVHEEGSAKRGPGSPAKPARSRPTFRCVECGAEDGLRNFDPTRVLIDPRKVANLRAQFLALVDKWRPLAPETEAASARLSAYEIALELMEREMGDGHVLNR